MIAELIKNEAYKKGSKDNMSVIVILFSGYGKSRSRIKRKKAELEALVSTPGFNRSASIDSQLNSMVRVLIFGLYKNKK